jgi:hypothetical protein
MLALFAGQLKLSMAVLKTFPFEIKSGTSIMIDWLFIIASSGSFNAELTKTRVYAAQFERLLTQRRDLRSKPDTFDNKKF